MHPIRSLFQLSFSYLVACEISACMIPILQSVFFALVVSMIFMFATWELQHIKNLNFINNMESS